MKKIIIVLIAMIGFAFAAKANNDVCNTQSLSVPDDSTMVSIEIISVSSDLVDILVYASNAVDDLCSYFSGSWVDAGLTVYCAFGGDVYTCTAYKVVQAACALNGAVRLSLQGDISATLKSLLYTSAKMYAVNKISSKFYITPAN